jgi:hypothetical protein
VVTHSRTAAVLLSRCRGSVAFGGVESLLLSLSMHLFASGASSDQAHCASLVFPSIAATVARHYKR